MNERVLIVEDEESIMRGLADTLKMEGFKTISARDGEEGLKAAQTKRPDLVLLDVMLPKMSGLDVCRKLRASGSVVPIIMLTARSEEIDKVLGLELGADDYVTKPFSPRELVSRIKAVLRRAAAARKLDKSAPKSIELGGFKADFISFEAEKDGRKVKFSPMEYKVLRYLASCGNEVVSREKLLDDVWGYEKYPSTRTVDNFIVKLRAAIEEDPKDPKYLLSVHGIGYKLKI